MNPMSSIIALKAGAFHRISVLPALMAVAGGSGDEGFRQVLMKTIPIAVVAFVVSGSFLVSLFRSLAEEAENGAVGFTPRSRRRMVYLILSLIGFGLIFGWMAFHAP